MRFHWFKNVYRRIRYGAGCCDIFGLDYYLAKKIIKPLKEFRRSLERNGGGYPSELNSMEEWLAILDKMIWSFEYLISGEEFYKENNNENNKKEAEGFELFGKYFRSLWI